ncbi:MAG: ABC transporter permease [Calditrichaeota bacterium]|nr:MAG: ABC transporter permease [Calditrichota bacterium]
MMMKLFKTISTGLFLSQHFVLYLCLAYFVVLWAIFPHMAGSRNLSNIASNMWPLLALVVGQLFVLVIGGIDLSQTSIMALTSVAGAALMSEQVDPVLFSKSPLWGSLLSSSGGFLAGNDFAVVAAIVVMLTLGALVGLMNGVSVAYFNMPPFIVTLVSMMFFSGTAIFLTASENITHLPSQFITLGKGGISVISYSFLIVLSLSLLAHVLLTRTVLGRQMVAVGLNRQAAVISGIAAKRLIVTAYIFSGLCAAIGSILYSARLEGGRPTLGQDLLLDVIGAAVIGGISLFGGKGKVIWAFYGVLFFVLLSNSLNMMNLSFFTIDMVKGAVILLAALLDVLRRRVSAGKKAAL